jgi:EAL domain-containing protein (putative c-di-GMP-specific phosphodiesterase class I)
MYRAKSQGSARYEIFNPDMHARAVALLQLETDLRNAFERQEFRLQYQPIVSLETGIIIGFEALLRWQHPQHGLQNPAEFIAAAEETGLLTHIYQWVLCTACSHLRNWQLKLPETLPLIISVNLSGKQFNQTNLIDQINQILQETGLDASSLRLEITEGAIMDSAESAATMLLQIRELGVQLSIDDFGTGYSSLGRLHHFPINGLKIDRSFVSQMGSKAGNSDIVETIVTLAHKLGVDVTAEGVETAEQLAQLKALKCDYGQGYFFSQPLDSEAAEVLIVANPQW